MTETLPILILVPGFPAHESDTSCLPAVQNYVEALGRRLPSGSLSVVAFQYPHARRSYEWRGIQVHALGGRNARFAKPTTWLRAVRAGRRFIAAHKSGVIHSFWLGECALIGELLTRLSGWRHVVSIGGQEVRRPTVYSRLLRRGSFDLIAGSASASAAVRRSLDRKVDAVIPIGLDVDRVARTEDPSHGDPRPIDILVVSSLIRIKRLEDVIGVAARLIGTFPHLAVEIVGDGPERARLERRTGDAGLGEHVVMRGPLSREEVLGLMRKSKVLLHPSEYESQGYVFLEALASGMYVVCREVGFHPESPNVTHAGNVEDMVAAVARRLYSPHEPVAVAVPPVDQTVDAFLALYGG